MFGIIFTVQNYAMWDISLELINAIERMITKVTLDHACFFPEKQKNTPSTLISVLKVSMLQAKYLSRYIIPPSVVSVITW